MTHTSKAGPVGCSFAAWLDGTNKPFLMGAVHATKKCGCRVIGNATLPHPLDIQYCATHAAAGEMFTALHAIVADWDAFDKPKAPHEPTRIKFARAAMMDATPKPKPLVQQVAEELVKLGVPASYEYPGFICIQRGDRCWSIGTQPQEGKPEIEWTGELTEDGQNMVEMSFRHPEDPAEIAKLIKTAFVG